MSFQSADLYSLIAFGVFSAVMVGLCYAAVRRIRRGKPWLLALVTLTLGASISAATGFTATHVIPVLPLIMGAALALGALFSFSSSGTALARRLSLSTLIGFQSIRLPLELILHHWVSLGTVPETMTWTGSNWDVLAGIVSLATFRYATKSRRVAWFAQVVGFLLLLNVFRVVILSSPFPFAWPLKDPLQLGLHFPYVLIIPLFVLPVWIAHLVTFRKLLESRPTEGSAPPS